MKNRLAAALMLAATLVLTACGGADDSADIVISGSAPTDPVAPGNSATFTMVVTNNGPDSIDDVLVTDVLDSRVTLQDITCTASGGARCPSTLDTGMTVPHLPSGGQVSFAVRVAVPAGVAGLVTNTLGTRAIPEDPNLDNNSLTVGVLIANAQLTVGYGAADIEAAGTPADFVASVANLGPGAAGDVSMSYTVPAGTTLGSIVCEPFDGAVCPTDLTANPLVAPTLPAGSRLLLRIPFTTPPELRGEITSTFTATTPSDPSPDNNVASDTTTIVAPTANLAVSHEVASSTVAGTEAVFSARVLNRSLSPSFNVALTETLPAGLSPSSVSCVATSGATCPPDASLGTSMTLGSLPAGGLLAFTYRVPLPLALAGSDVTATFQATADGDPASGDNTRAATTSVRTPNADLRATHYVQANTNAGTPVPFIGAISNLGPDTARGVVVTYGFANGVVPDSIACTAVGGAVCPASTGASMPVADMPAGSTLQFTAVVTAGAAGSTLTGTIAASTDGDLLPANNSASASSAVVTPPASLSAALSVPAVSATGSTAVFTARVTNGGPNTASNLSLGFVLDAPAGLAVSDVSCSASAGATCPAALGTTMTAPSLPAGAWLQFRFSVPVPGGATPGGVLEGTFSSSASGDPAVDDNVATASSTISAAAANLAVSHTVAAETPQGQAASFVGLVTNQGPNTARNLQVLHTLSPDVAGVTVTCTAFGGATCPTVADPATIDVASLPSGAALRLVYTVPTGGLTPGSTLQGRLQSTYAGDPIPDDDSATASTAITATADARNGDYTVHAANGLRYTLTLDFDHRAYTMAGNGFSGSGSFGAADADGNHTIAGNARLRTGPDVVVGGFDFGSGVVPFFGARRFAASVAEIAPADPSDLTLMSRVLGASGQLSRYTGARVTGSELLVCGSDNFLSLENCPVGERVTYALSVDGDRFTGTNVADPADSISFRVALTGSERIWLRTAVSPTDTTQRIFQIGLPEAAGIGGGSFWGATTAGDWGLTTLTGGTPATYGFNGSTADSATLSVVFTGGPTGVRGGFRTSDGAGVVVMQVGSVSVLLGARNTPAAGHVEIGLAP